MRVEGSGFRVRGAGCRVQGAGCRVQGAGCRVHNTTILEREGGERKRQSERERETLMLRGRERICIELMPSDRQLKAFREGSKGRIYGG